MLTWPNTSKLPSNCKPNDDKESNFLPVQVSPSHLEKYSLPKYVLNTQTNTLVIFIKKIIKRMLF